MNMLVKAALSAALLVGTSLNALAVERGGTLKYGRYADSLFLDPVLNDANVDIWILSNLYDTLILPTDDGKGLKPGLATEWKVADDGLSVTLTLRDGIKFSDGSPITPADVQWSLKRAADPKKGIWGFLVGLDPGRHDRGRPHGHHQAEEHRSGDPRRPHRLQHGDPADEGVRGLGRGDRRGKGQELLGASDQFRSVRPEVLGPRPVDEAGAQRELLGARARTASRSPISTASTSRSSPMTRPAS